MVQTKYSQGQTLDFGYSMGQNIQGKPRNFDKASMFDITRSKCYIVKIYNLLNIVCCFHEYILRSILNSYICARHDKISIIC